MNEIAEALWYVSRGKAELRKHDLPQPGKGLCRIRMLWSGISRGTEALVAEGNVPESEWGRMRAPFQEGDFPFPVKYGYAAIGRVEIGSPELIGKTVFALHPHQDIFNLPEAAATILPAGLPAQRAILAANMETALNATWDAGVSPADRIAVVGGGVLGLLTGYLCARMPGTQVSLVDLDPGREGIARALGMEFALVHQAPRECDLVIHASGHADGLATALSLAGQEATILELSWYGTRPVTLALGGAFHAKRLRLISSQVGQISPGHRPRWDYRRRLEAALRLLLDERLDALLAPEIAFRALPDELPRLLAPDSGVLAQLVRYD